MTPGLEAATGPASPATRPNRRVPAKVIVTVATKTASPPTPIPTPTPSSCVSALPDGDGTAGRVLARFDG